MKHETRNMKQKYETRNTQHETKPMLHASCFMFHGRGFTLLEMVIVTGLFSILVVSATGLLATGLKAQKSAGAVHEVLQNVWYAEGQLAQGLIFSSVKPFKSETDSTLQGDGTYSEIWIKNIKDGEAAKVRYFLNTSAADCAGRMNTICERRVGAVTTVIPLTSVNVEVDRLSFVLQGNAKQPQITVIMGARSKVAPQQRIDIEATVSMRAITFE